MYGYWETERIHRVNRNMNRASLTRFAQRGVRYALERHSLGNHHNPAGRYGKSAPILLQIGADLKVLRHVYPFVYDRSSDPGVAPGGIVVIPKGMSLKNAESTLLSEGSSSTIRMVSSDIVLILFDHRVTENTEKDKAQSLKPKA